MSPASRKTHQINVKKHFGYIFVYEFSIYYFIGRVENWPLISHTANIKCKQSIETGTNNDCSHTDQDTDETNVYIMDQ